LKEIRLNLRQCPRVALRGLNPLAEAFKRLKFLQTISLDFMNSQITDDYIRKIVKGLKMLPALQNLFLQFAFCSNLTDSAFFEIKKFLKRKTRLKTLTISFQKCHKFTSKGLNYLNQSLETLTSLQNLKLDFSWCSQIYGNGLNSLFTNGLKGLVSLQYLGLIFP